MRLALFEQIAVLGVGGLTALPVLLEHLDRAEPSDLHGLFEAMAALAVHSPNIVPCPVARLVGDELFINGRSARIARGEVARVLGAMGLIGAALWFRWECTEESLTHIQSREQPAMMELFLMRCCADRPRSRGLASRIAAIMRDVKCAKEVCLPGCWVTRTEDVKYWAARAIVEMGLSEESHMKVANEIIAQRR